VPALLRERPQLEVVMSEGDGTRVAGVTRTVADGDRVQLGRIEARAIANPGHTLGAISFHVEAHGAEPGALFTGDTLFSAGCGRLFEGTAAQMHASLVRLTSVPDETRVFFGHEYTEANLRFAAAVEPDNHAIAARAEEVAAMRARGLASTPSTVAIERETNPFVRVDQPSVTAAAMRRDASAIPSEEDADPAAVFAVIRAWKDGFR